MLGRGNKFESVTLLQKETDWWDTEERLATDANVTHTQTCTHIHAHIHMYQIHDQVAVSKWCEIGLFNL